ncbi:MAG: allophanate hydrolase [Roseinatronobacter sp.]
MTPPTLPTMLTLPALRAFYARGGTPLDLVEAVLARRAANPDPAVFLLEIGAEDLRARAHALMDGPRDLPLWGIPCALKDNIDIAGLPTTAACPAFAYTPDQDATVTARLQAAGAIILGKTNLDQFATGLNGTRSPHGAPRSVFDPAYVSGGSSSGSAVAVASGLCSFALGTDTAGSGRVPAAFNNLVGIKPTPGLVPNTGIVPACRSVDVVTVFAATVTEGAEVRRVIEGFDAGDPFSRVATPVGLPARLRLGILTGPEREFHGNAEVEALYDAACAQAEALGATLVPFDYAPFREAAALLYEGPWVAERLAAIEPFLDAQPDALDPTVRQIIEGARAMSAADAFRGRYRLEELRQITAPVWQSVDALLLPTSPTTCTVAAMRADPLRLNSKFGRYTNFVNLMGLAAISVPMGFGPSGLPAGASLIGPGFSDDALVPFAARLHQACGQGLGVDRTAPIPDAPPPTLPAGMIPLVVVGAHLTGLPLNRELIALGAQFLAEARTAPGYRLFALPGTHPPKPGMIRDPAFTGPGIAVEIWALPPAAFGQFAAAIPEPLGLGKVQLEGGRAVPGFLCEAHATRGAQDITAYGGWRAFIAAQ